MAFTAHPGASYNIIGSFNDFFQTQLTAKGLPDFMPSAVVNYDWPNQPLTFPSFSITHLGSEVREVAQGRHLDPGWKGAEQIGIAEVDVWESYQRASGNHWRNIRIMADMARRVFATGAAISILDVYGSTATATGTGTVVRVGPMREAPLGLEPNPDVTRIRLLC